MEHTLTLNDDELRVMRLALANWDGWDHTICETVSDEFDAVHLALRIRLQHLVDAN
jgi:hypothetical protein